MLEALPDLFLRSEVLDKVKKFENMLSVPLDCLIICQFEVADASMVVLDGFLLQLSTFIRVDLEVIIFAPVFLAVFLELSF